MPCEIIIGDHRQRGFLLDVSSNGVFVQTLKAISSDQEIGVEFTPPGLDTKIQLRARVVRIRQVPARLTSVIAPGVGLRITTAPPEYQAFLASLLSSSPGASDRKGDAQASERPPSTVPESPPGADSDTRYRVRVKHTSGPRSRSILVAATSREHAESQAIAELGDNWQVIDVETA